LIVAHRLSTLEHVDVIVVVGEGRVLEMGKHEDLLAKGEEGIYYKLWNAQNKSASSVPNEK
jgi:ABC-type multidrug transport system fused ATPase/permease subunit